MSLALATVTSAGIVLTADSKQTYRNALGAIRVGSESATKLFKLCNRAAVAIAGRAYLADASGSLKDVGYFIEEFKTKQTELLQTASIKDIAGCLNDHLAAVFIERDMEIFRTQLAAAVASQGGRELIFKDPNGNIQPYSYKDQSGITKEDAAVLDTIDFLIAGADDDRVERAYSARVPQGAALEYSTQQGGLLYIGQGQVLDRIIRGYDPSGVNLPFVKAALAL